MVNELALDHVGLALDEGFDAWDSVDADTALAIASKLKDVVVVAPSLAVERDQILRTVEAVSPSILHLARAVDCMTHEALSVLRAEIASVRLMVTAPVVGWVSVKKACDLAQSADFLLLDSAHPATRMVGATGLVHDSGVPGDGAAESGLRYRYVAPGRGVGGPWIIRDDGEVSELADLQRAAVVGVDLPRGS
jgi:hypothetical protein